MRAGHQVAGGVAGDGGGEGGGRGSNGGMGGQGADAGAVSPGEESNKGLPEGLPKGGVRERQRALLLAAAGGAGGGAGHSPAQQSAPLTPGIKGRRPGAQYPPGMVSPRDSVPSSHSSPSPSSLPLRGANLSSQLSAPLPSLQPPSFRTSLPLSRGDSQKSVQLGSVFANVGDSGAEAGASRAVMQEGSERGAEFATPRQWRAEGGGDRTLQTARPVVTPGQSVSGKIRERAGGAAVARESEGQHASQPEQLAQKNQEAAHRQDPQSPPVPTGHQRFTHQSQDASLTGHQRFTHQSQDASLPTGHQRFTHQSQDASLRDSQPASMRVTTSPSHLTPAAVPKGRRKSLEGPPIPYVSVGKTQKAESVALASGEDGSNDDSDDASVTGSTPGVVFSRRSNKSAKGTARGGGGGAAYLGSESQSKMHSGANKSSFVSRRKKKLLNVLGRWRVESSKVQEKKMMLASLFHDIEALDERDDDRDDDSSDERDNLEDSRQEKSKEESSLDHWWVLVTNAIRKLVANDGKGRRLTINCGGISNQVWEKTLRRFPGTTLTKMVVTGELKNSNVAYLDRNPYAFVEILNAYRAGPGEEFGVIPEEPAHISPDMWVHELSHFRMDQAHIPKLDRLMMRYNDEDLDDMVGRPKSGFRAFLFMLMEEPTSSSYAWAYSCFSFLIIMASVSLVIIETIPEIAVQPDDPSEPPQPPAVIDNLDFDISVFMTFEYLVRMAVSVDRRAFVIAPLNIVDVVAILPSYFTYLIAEAKSFSGAKLFRVIRILRIIKLTRHSDGMMVLAKTAEACSDELGLLLFCLIVFSILFASLVFFAEGNDTNGPAFQSIPHTMWWAVVTMTTIGYGDMYPTTGLGQLFGALCALSGVVMVALPISVLSMTFSYKFAEHRSQQQVKERRRQRQKRMKEEVITRFLDPDIQDEDAKGAFYVAHGYMRRALSMVLPFSSPPETGTRGSSPSPSRKHLHSNEWTSQLSMLSSKERTFEMSQQILDQRNLAMQREGTLKDLVAMQHDVKTKAHH